MTTPLRVTPLGPDDTDALVALGDLTVRAYRALAPDPAVSDYVARLRRVADRFGPGVEVLAARDEADRILGGVTFVAGADAALAEFDDPDAAGFRHLAVDPDAQGRGVGRRLVLACLDRAVAQGRRQVLIHTGAWMTAAHLLYEVLGFDRRTDRDRTTPSGVRLLAYGFDLADPGVGMPARS